MDSDQKGTKKQRTTSKLRRTTSTASGGADTMPEVSDASILDIADEKKFQAAIAGKSPAEQLALKLVWGKTKHSKSKAPVQTPYATRKKGPLPLDCDDSPELGPTSTQLTTGQDSAKNSAPKSHTPLVDLVLNGDSPPKSSEQSRSGVVQNKESSSPAISSGVGEPKAVDNSGKIPLKDPGSLSALARRRRLAALSASNARLNGINLKGRLVAHENREYNINEMADLLAANNHYGVTQFQFEVFTAALASALMDDMTTLRTKIGSIEGDICMLMDDTINLDDKVSEYEKTAAVKRDEILAKFLELQESVAASESRISSYAAVVSSRSSSSDQASSSTSQAASKRKLPEEGVTEAKKSKLEQEPNNTTTSHTRKGVPVDFRGRAADEDLVVSLLDPTDPLSPMFPWGVNLDGQLFPCITLALMMAEAKATGNTELENGVFACKPYFVKHNGTVFDQKYYDFVGRLNPAWNRIWLYEISQGEATAKSWFNVGTGNPFDLLYDSIEEAKATRAYSALKKILTDALWINPQFRQLLWQTGKERIEGKVVDNPRFIRATGFYPNAGWRGALICGADKRSTELNRGRGRGRGGPRGGPAMNPASSYYQRGAPQRGRGYNRGAAFGSFRNRGSISATPIQSAYVTTKFDGTTEPAAPVDTALDDVTESLFTEAKSSAEVKNGDADWNSVNARINDLMKLVKKKRQPSTVRQHSESEPEPELITGDEEPDNEMVIRTPMPGALNGDEEDIFDEGALFEEENEFESPEPVVRTDTVNSAAPPQASALASVACTSSAVDAKPDEPILSQVAATRKRRAELKKKRAQDQQSITTFLSKLKGT